MLKKVSVIVGITVGLLTIGGGVVAVCDYFAKAEDLKLVEYRLDQKIRQDNCNRIQDRIWMLEDRYRGKDMPKSVKEEYRTLKLRYDNECRMNG